MRSCYIISDTNYGVEWLLWTHFSWIYNLENSFGDLAMCIVKSSQTQAYPIDGLVQDCCNSSALAMKLLQSCTRPSIWGMLPWQPLLGPLSWYPIFKSRFCNSFEDQAPIYGCLIFKWVAETWLYDTVLGLSSLREDCQGRYLIVTMTLFLSCLLYTVRCHEVKSNKFLLCLLGGISLDL